MISSAKQILESTFVGTIRKNLVKTANKVLPEIFKTERPEINNYKLQLLMPYFKGFTSEADLLKVGIKLSSSLIDYAIVNKSFVKDAFDNLFTGSNSIWTQISTAKQNGLDNYFINALAPVDSNLFNGGTGIKIEINTKIAIDQNKLTASLRVLKEENPALYKAILTTAFVQGTSVSPFSFADLIPIEDFQEIVNPIINTLSEAH